MFNYRGCLTPKWINLIYFRLKSTIYFDNIVNTKVSNNATVHFFLVFHACTIFDKQVHYCDGTFLFCITHYMISEKHKT